MRGVLPPPHGEDELVTRPWPDGPAPGPEPGCPEMSSGSLGDPSPFLCLRFRLGPGGLPRTPFLRDPSAPGDPPVAARAGRSSGQRMGISTRHRTPDSSPQLSTGAPRLAPASKGVANVPPSQRTRLRRQGAEMTGWRVTASRRSSLNSNPGSLRDLGPPPPSPPPRPLRDATRDGCCVFQVHGEVRGARGVFSTCSS